MQGRYKGGTREVYLKLRESFELRHKGSDPLLGRRIKRRLGVCLRHLSPVYLPCISLSFKAFPVHCTAIIVSTKACGVIYVYIYVCVWIGMSVGYHWSRLGSCSTLYLPHISRISPVHLAISLGICSMLYLATSPVPTVHLAISLGSCSTGVVQTGSAGVSSEQGQDSVYKQQYSTM